ncbi:hypothetical protein WICMUC_004138 [Wickerhamomyces mucosus]|uniref:Uncharacterized protein n=1 Tax=Wickerhamomyces mucosus TaxID=1378264 RepID=A0A9P8PK15_9ASCO|nr:hypothetical protein WICMUC_004138 [Wickerhamomyces mucosus]
MNLGKESNSNIFSICFPRISNNGNNLNNKFKLLKTSSIVGVLGVSEEFLIEFTCGMSIDRCLVFFELILSCSDVRENILSKDFASSNSVANRSSLSSLYGG